MSAASWVQFAVFIVVTVVTGSRSGGTWPGSTATTAEGTGRPDLRARSSGSSTGSAGIDPTREQRWTTYAYALLAFSICSFLAVYLFQRFQEWLPLNPTDVGNVIPHLSFNTAVSFVTNTNWQSLRRRVDA